MTKEELVQHRDNWYKKILQCILQNEEVGMNEVPSIKFYREKGYQDIKLCRVQTGAELLGYTFGVSAMELSND